MIVSGTIDLCPDGNSLIKTFYSKERNDYLKSIGFFYSKVHKGHIKKFSKEDIFFIKSSDLKIGPRLREEIETYSGEIEAIACHSDLAGEGIDHTDLVIDTLPSQKVTLKFIRANKGRCIVGHEWGAGKLLPALIFAYEQEGEALIVCDPNFIANVKNEIKRFFFDSDAFLSRVTIRGYDGISDIVDNKYRVVILDESQKFQDLRSVRFKNACKISKNSEALILLTGNNISRWPIGFYSQLKILGIDMTKERYIKRFFDVTFENKRMVPGKLREDVLKTFIAPFYIRKKLSDVWPNGSAKVEKRIIEPSKEELKFYENFLTNIDPIFSSKTIISINRFLTMMKLRQLPAIIKGIIESSPDANIAVVSQFAESLPVIEKNLGMSVKKYEGEDCKDYQIIFVNSSLYKEGLTIVDRDVVIILDSFATKINDIQLKRRFYRIGISRRVLFMHLTFKLMDMEILNMPEFTDHLKMNQYLENKLSGYKQKAS